jgi:hypothetical protein
MRGSAERTFAGHPPRRDDGGATGAWMGKALRALRQTASREYHGTRVLQLSEKEARLDLRPESYDFPHGGGPPDTACQIQRSVSRRDLLSHLCRDGCALWSRSPCASAPTLQHPPFPQVWCGPPNRTSCMPVAQADGPIPMHECRPLSPPGCFRIRLRIPPSLSWRNIGACRSAGPPSTCLFARISSVDA